MKLKVYHHCVDLPHWYDIAVAQLEKMKRSGLLAHCDLYMHINYTESNFDSIKKKYANYKNIHWIFQKNLRKDYDFPTFIAMQNMAQSTEEDYNILYIHLKGITHIGTVHERPTRDWRILLEYFNIERWTDCIDKLNQGYDAVGCLFKRKPIPHYSGNIQWSKASFIRRCIQLKLPSKIRYVNQSIFKANSYHNYRHDVEFWYGHNKAKFYSLHKSQIDHYWKMYPPNLYR